MGGWMADPRVGSRKYLQTDSPKVPLGWARDPPNPEHAHRRADSKGSQDPSPTVLGRPPKGCSPGTHGGRHTSLQCWSWGSLPRSTLTQCSGSWALAPWESGCNSLVPRQQDCPMTSGCPPDARWPWSLLAAPAILGPNLQPGQRGCSCR